MESDGCDEDKDVDVGSVVNIEKDDVEEDEGIEDAEEGEGEEDVVREGLL